MVAYKVDFSYNAKVELLNAVMTLYSVTMLGKELSHKERTVLREYILYGYNKQTKDNIKLSLGITSSNINTLNYTLQQKGFLRPHPNNQRLKILNPQLKELQECFMSDEKKKAFIVNFVEDGN